MAPLEPGQGLGGCEGESHVSAGLGHGASCVVKQQPRCGCEGVTSAIRGLWGRACPPGSTAPASPSLTHRIFPTSDLWVFPTPAGWPAIRFNSDTDQLAQTPQGKGSVPQLSPTSAPVTSSRSPGYPKFLPTWLQIRGSLDILPQFNHLLD